MSSPVDPEALQEFSHSDRFLGRSGVPEEAAHADMVLSPNSTFVKSTVLIDNTPHPTYDQMASGSQIDESDARGHLPRLSQVLFEFPRRNFGSLATLPSNVQALDAAMLFSVGMQPFVAIVGPSGWGKSHLLEAVASRLSLEEGVVPPVHMATEWALGTARSEPMQPLLLDNAQDAIEQSRTRQAMRLALERRVRAGRPTILCFTASKASRLIRSLLPQPRSWAVTSIGAPEPMERILVVEQMARVEGLQLAGPLIKLIAFRMRGNGRTLTGALKRLKLFGSCWPDASATIRACGILNPFLSDNPDWDLADVILRAAGKVGEQELPSLEIRREIALYLMLRQANLAENEVARALGIEPGEAYLRATAAERKVLQTPEYRRFVGVLTDRVLRELLPA